jgi:hypothetical protein
MWLNEKRVKTLKAGKIMIEMKKNGTKTMTSSTRNDVERSKADQRRS